MRSLLPLALLLPLPAMAEDWLPAGFDIGGQVGVELRVFPQAPLFPGQFEHVQPSLFAEPEIEWQSEDRDTQFRFVPFLRLDGQDEERTHFDVRELYLSHDYGDVEVLFGANRVFWGVTESRHLVNIINQIDQVEDVDEEDFLGQPMLNVGIQTDLGRVDAFFMTGFRDRTFAGIDGRLRTPVPVDTERGRFESDLGRWRPEFALRYSHFVGAFDIGAHVFHGTGREPVLVTNADGSLVPRYDVITQGGLDLQYTTDATLWKFEGLIRAGQGDVFGAVVAGVEYTFFGAFDSDADIGLLAEGLFDGRDATTDLTAEDVALGAVAAQVFPTTFEHDVFLASRLTLNDVQDTAVLGGIVIDTQDGPQGLRLEAERRLGQSWKIELEAQVTLEQDSTAPAGLLRRDSFVTTRLSKFF
ncbi:MAG: hypothetical protein AAFS07_09575 [Pseudomonadota bacterium]